jgi:hypothetical protein
VEVYKLLKKLGAECQKHIKTAPSELMLITQIRDKRLPSGGLAELQGAVDSEMKCVARDRKHREPAGDQSSHDRLLEALFGARLVTAMNISMQPSLPLPAPVFRAIISELLLNSKYIRLFH